MPSGQELLHACMMLPCRDMLSVVSRPVWCGAVWGHLGRVAGTSV